MDFLASNDDLDTSQLNWTLEAVKVDYDANRLAAAPPVGALVSRDFTELPTGLDPIVHQLATAGHRRGVDPLREGGGAPAVVP